MLAHRGLEPHPTGKSQSAQCGSARRGVVQRRPHDDGCCRAVPRRCGRDQSFGVEGRRRPRRGRLELRAHPGAGLSTGLVRDALGTRRLRAHGGGGALARGCRAGMEGTPARRAGLRGAGRDAPCMRAAGRPSLFGPAAPAHLRAWLAQPRRSRDARPRVPAPRLPLPSQWRGRGLHRAPRRAAWRVDDGHDDSMLRAARGRGIRGGDHVGLGAGGDRGTGGRMAQQRRRGRGIPPGSELPGVFRECPGAARIRADQGHIAGAAKGAPATLVANGVAMPLSTY